MTLQKLITALEEEQRQIADGLMKMGVSSFDAYKEMLGRHSGLQIAIDKIRETTGTEDDE